MKQLLLLLTFFFTLSAAYSQDDPTASRTDLRNHILKESREKGQLDFFTPIKGHEYDGIQIKPGIYDTKLGLALIKWGKANYDLGVKNLDEAYSIFAEFKGREARKLEKEYIKIGYNRELEM
jgi:hypothetical protein